MPKDSKKSKKVTSKDVPGVGKKGGQARAAARAIEKGKSRNRDALSVAKSILMRNQSTDAHQ